MDEEAQIHATHSHVPEKYLKLIEIDSEEQVICAIRKHPIGLLPIYATGILIAIVTVTSLVFLGAFIDSQVSLPTLMIGALIGAILGLGVLFAMYVSAFVYKNNILILTNEKVAQIIYTNLIDRKVSQISLGELQDITVDQKGLLSRVFKFGTLVLETAGEQNNYNFTYTMYPQHCAREIVSAHEVSIRRYGN